MWIRSQCGEVLVELKENVAINKITIHGELKMTSETTGVMGYNEWVISVGNYVVGIYETKERALEVLLEIQNAIIRDTEYVSTPIYEMPKE